MQKVFRTDEEKQALIAQVEEKVRSGSTITQAEKESGLQKNQYHVFRRQLRRGPSAPKKPYVERIEMKAAPVEKQKSKLVCLIGDADDIAEAIKKWQK